MARPLTLRPNTLNASTGPCQVLPNQCGTRVLNSATSPAQACDVPVGTIRSRVARAREQMLVEHPRAEARRSRTAPARSRYDELIVAGVMLVVLVLAVLHVRWKAQRAAQVETAAAAEPGPTAD